MGLDTDLGNVIAASQALIDTFESKKSDIEAAIAAVMPTQASVVNSFIGVNYYVDAIDGNDSNTGLNWDDAVQTLDSLYGKLPTSGYVRINLREGQTHQFTKVGTLKNGLIFINGGNVSNKATLIIKGVDYSGYAKFEGVQIQAGQLILESLIIESEYTGSQSIANTSGFVSYGTGKLSVLAYLCDFNLSNCPMMSCQPGYREADLLLRGCTINRVEDAEYAKLLFNRAAVFPLISLSVDSVQLTGASTNWGSVLPIAADKSNIRANITL